MNSALIVECDSLRRRQLAVLLGRQGWQVHAVDTLSAARALLDEPPVHVVYINEAIDDDSGYRLLAAIREHPHWRNARVVMAGCDETTRSAACALELDADGYAPLHWPLNRMVTLLTRRPALEFATPESDRIR